MTNLRKFQAVEGKELKEKLRAELEIRRSELVRLSLNIHDNPELGFQEVKAASWLSDYLKSNGFSVERNIAGLSTAFRAVYGEGKPKIVVLAEYDALPGIGHGCGHNIIAASAVGAGVASKIVVDNLGGSIIVLGTPGEENFGSKIDMVKAGIFDDVDVAMMVHPSILNIAMERMLASSSLEVEFFGKAAHAAVQPSQGVNALEAIILAFNSINSLRQHIKEQARIHGIITDGGEAPNVVPAHSAAKFMIRAPDYAYLEELQGKVLNCFKGASLASGARLKYRWGDKVYAPIKNNVALAKLFSDNLELMGRRLDVFDLQIPFGSSDMGNVSQVVPSIHPMVAIVSPKVSLHSVEFASAAASEAGHQGLLDAAKAMAMTMVDVIGRPEVLEKIKQEFRSS
jgi:amidohydrolase